MKLSEQFFYTLRETPKDEESVSGQLLVRAGMIKKTSSGIYMLMPLGFKVMKKIEKVVIEEMNKAGASQLLMPTLIEEKVYEQSKRRELFGNDMFSLQDKFGKKYVLGPTHEELFLECAKMKINSYKDMPFTIYQIGTKYRDETRPRYGMIRVREFSMKDAYSFDKDTNGLDISYQKMFEAYKKIYDRLGVKYKIVKADVGNMGGSLSEEFQAITDIGEDTIEFCHCCDYAANIEVSQVKEKGICPTCGKELEYKKCIEIGNTFKLGTKYSDTLNLKYMDQNNKSSSIVMGCYGIGLGRILSSVIEQNNDQHGMIWPNDEIAPYQVYLAIANAQEEDQRKIAEELYENLTNAGIEAILDDRKELSLSVKLKDADLIGIPYKCIIGKRLADGIIEVKKRTTNEVEEIKIADIIRYFTNK